LIDWKKGVADLPRDSFTAEPIVTEVVKRARFLHHVKILKEV
jgi:hypothetical protein